MFTFHTCFTCGCMREQSGIYCVISVADDVTDGRETMRSIRHGNNTSDLCSTRIMAHYIK